jgi:penicillin amidase
MKDAGRSLPMWATGFVPQPWNQRSVLLLGNLLSFGGLAVGQQQNERILLDLIHSGVGDDKLRELFSPLLDNADFNLLRRVNTASAGRGPELITTCPLAGSNAWAASPGRTRTLALTPRTRIWKSTAAGWYSRTALG